ncbi:hypothetical protein BS17DRAFT_743186 [Gyrodon lividus]|nr:hypothetical protein BS17DRAFT_743186 [Gyrodon lividus]
MPTFTSLYTTPNTFDAVYIPANFIPLLKTTVSNSGISIPVGIFIGLLASFVQSLGLAIQRRSHVLNSQLPEPERKTEHRRPVWLLGFAIFLISNIFGSFIQIASLPVVILAPLGAVSLLWNALFAQLLFRPPLFLGTALIAGGAALIAVYGIVPETPRSLDELMALFARPAFIVSFCVEGAVVLVCLIVTHVVEYSLTRRLEAASYVMLRPNGESIESSLCTSHESSPGLSPTSLPPVHQRPLTLTSGLTAELVTSTLAHERAPLLGPKMAHSSQSSSPKSLHKYRPSSPRRSASAFDAFATPLPPIAGRTPLLLALAYAAASGTLSGLCLIFAKSGVELLVLTLKGSNQFSRWESWALVCPLVVFALGQLWYLNRGLRFADPAFVCPSAFCFYNFSSILNGLVYFNQLSQLSGSRISLVVLGMVILLAGVWAVSAQASIDNGYPDEQDGSEESIPEDITDTTALTPAMRRRSFSIDTSPHTPFKSQSKNKAQSKRGIEPIAAPPMGRQSHSEGALRPEGSMSMYTLDSTSPPLRPGLTLPRTSSQCTVTPTHSELISPTTSRSSRRRRPTVLDSHCHLYPHGGSSIRAVSSSVSGGVPGQGISPAGLTIGLSPVSPGFGFGVGPGGVGVGGQGQRRSRRVSGLGLGPSFSNVVESVEGGDSLGVEDGDRRRAVSEGDVRRRRWDNDYGDQVPGDEEETYGAGMAVPAPVAHGDAEMGLDGTVYPLTAGLRWTWVRKVFQGGKGLVW